MADGNASYEISYHLSGEGQVVRGIRNMDNATRRLRGSTGGLSEGLKGLAGRFVGLQLVANYAMQKGREMIKWIQDSIKEFREFELRIAEVGTIMGEVGSKELPALSSGIEHLSVSFGKGADDLAKGMYDILSAAFSARDAMSLLTVATKASIAGLSTVETSVDALTSVLNAYGKSAYQATRISDIMFQTVIRGKLKYEDLAASMGYIVPIAANLGVEFEEIAAALTTVTRQGQHVDMATRGLALMIQNIADMTPAASEAAEEYGINLSSVALQVGGLDYILEELNTAMSVHGTKILPEVIRNMRSLRVAYALAGDEGIAGYLEDLKLMELSTGKTEVAMGSMMHTLQQQTSMLGEEMNRVERDIGEAWAGFDIWWKKASMWWGTLLSGGDADAAIAKHEARITRIRENYSALMLDVSGGAKPLDLFTELNDAIATNIENNLPTLGSEIDGIIDKTIDWGNVNKYFALQSDMFDYSTQRESVAKLSAAVILLEGDTRDATQVAKGFKNAMGFDWDETALTIKNIESLRSLFNEVQEGGITSEAAMAVLRIPKKYKKEGYGEIYKKYDDLTKAEEDAYWNFHLQVLRIVENADLREKINNELLKPFVAGDMSFNAMIEKMIGEDPISGEMGGLLGDYADILQEDIDGLADPIEQASAAFNELQGAIDGTVENMRVAQDNILTLENELMNLDKELNDVYKTAGGHEFVGTMRWQIAVAGVGVALDRFQHYAQMSIKYGDEMETGYMSGIQGIIEGVDDASDSLSPELVGIQEINADAWADTIAGTNDAGEAITEYDGTIYDVITTLSDYNAAMREVKKIQQGLTDDTKELRLAMLGLNLDVMNIQLKGMMRRRGLTRSEEKILKKIRIKQTQNRIEQLKLQYTAEEDMADATKDIHQDEFDEAQQLYQEYVDRVSLYLWQLQDARESELEDFINSMETKERYYILYNSWLNENNLLLDANAEALQSIAEEVSDNAPAWEEYFEKDPIEWAKGVISNIREEIEKIQSLTGGDTGGGDTGGGGGGDITGGTSFGSVGLTAPDITPIPNDNSGSSGITNPFIDAAVRAAVGGGIMGGRSLARGTNYVPKTQPYMLHRGEQVIPPGGDNISDGGVNIYITNNNAISSDMDAENVARIMAESIKTRLSDETGRSRYRFR